MNNWDESSAEESSLSKIPLGVKCKVIGLTAEGAIRRRLLDLGLILDTEIIGIMKSPWGDPTAYLIRGTVIALRCEDASNIIVKII